MSPKEVEPKLIAKNDKLELYAVPGRYGERPGIMTHDTQSVDVRAKMAAAFVERWALVAGEPDGEDSAGRQKLRTMTAEELAGKACKVVDALFSEFESRGWILPPVTIADVIAALQEEKPQQDNPQLRQTQSQGQDEQP